jgi:7-cyano-7-deazaguanine synthase
LSLGVDYGQRHLVELMYALTLCKKLGVRREVLTIEDMPKSMLTDPQAIIPDAAYSELPAGVSPTYVPFRNGQLLSKAAARASVEKNPIVIYCGMHAEDASRDAYPDCTFHFLGAMASAIYIGTYHHVRLNAPLVSMFKDEVVALGERLGLIFELTWSCYAGAKKHCGSCPTCRSRKDAFNKAGVHDPTKYEN